MKKVFLLSVMALLSVLAVAQSVTVKFTGATTEGNYCQISAVDAIDQTHGWSQSLAYPDTILILNYSDGIGEMPVGVGLSQNMPNPFDGHTESVLTLSKAGHTQIQLVGMNGAVLADYAAYLGQGQYRVGLTMEEVGMAILSVVTTEGRYAIKLFNTGRTASNGIEVNAVQQIEKKSKSGTKAVGTGFFALGDTMSYSATAVYDGVTYESNLVTKAQYDDETVTFVFDIPTEQVPEGAVSGKFSVSETTQVYFSQGNLQFQASTGTWRFADVQYGCIGEDNNNVSSTYSGWIDLFCWGTSGWNSGANEYQPYAVSMSSSDYMPGGDQYNSLVGDYANADWGIYNAIFNGGNEAGLWRTLTSDEWNYIFNIRQVSTIGEAENARYAKGTVNGMFGVMLFPDAYIHPSGVAVPSAINVDTASYASNSYSGDDWDMMEDAGVVFLPTAGYRHNETFYGETYGNYWSSTAYNVGYAYGVYFEDGFLMSDGGTYYRASGRSVRLVRTIE